MSQALDVFVLTPEGARKPVEVRSVRLPGEDGLLGVLPRHAPMLALVRCGVARLVRSGGEVEDLAVGSGWARVDGRAVHLTVDFANAADEVDRGRAHGAMRRALDRLEERDKGLDVARAEAALGRAFVRLHACGCSCGLCRSAACRV